MGFWSWLDNRLCTAANVAILAAAATYLWSAVDRVRLGDSPGSVVLLWHNNEDESRIEAGLVRILGGICVVVTPSHYRGYNDVQTALRSDGTAGGMRWVLPDGGTPEEQRAWFERHCREELAVSVPLSGQSSLPGQCWKTTQTGIVPCDQ
jgi:hypothetical protein